MSTEFSVRPATPDDEDAITTLLKASYPVLMATGYDEPTLDVVLPLMTRANPKLLSSGTFYLAESADGEITGCGGWTFEHPGSGETEPGLAHIRHFSTHPGWTGRGVGRAILERCATDAKAAGATLFQCYSSLNAEGFYAALGFRKVRRQEVSMSGKIMLSVIFMERQL